MFFLTIFICLTSDKSFTILNTTNITYNTNHKTISTLLTILIKLTKLKVLTMSTLLTEITLCLLANPFFSFLIKKTLLYIKYNLINFKLIANNKIKLESNC